MTYRSPSYYDQKNSPTLRFTAEEHKRSWKFRKSENVGNEENESVESEEFVVSDSRENENEDPTNTVGDKPPKYRRKYLGPSLEIW